jgi:transposase
MPPGWPRCWPWGTLPAVWVPPQPMREVRRLVYYRARLASSRRRAINQAKVVLRRAGHVLPRETDVRRWLTAERVAALPGSDRVILLSTCRQITALEAEIDGIEGEIARGVADVPAIQVLLTITGVGLITAAATWAIVGDPHRFSRPKQVARYAGLDPSIFNLASSTAKAASARRAARSSGPSWWRPPIPLPGGTMAPLVSSMPARHRRLEPAKRLSRWLGNSSS